MALNAGMDVLEVDKVGKSEIAGVLALLGGMFENDSGGIVAAKPGCDGVENKNESRGLDKLDELLSRTI
jgi:hypothetical protein